MAEWRRAVGGSTLSQFRSARARVLRTPNIEPKASALMDWRPKAACLDHDPELFFPIGSTGPALDQVAQAKAVCQRCPVIDTCLEWALRTNQHDGIWGGLSEEERRAHRRNRQRKQRER